MNQRLFCMLMAWVLALAALTGCRAAPEVSPNSEVSHAKSVLEKEVEKIAAGQPENGTEPGESYDALIGTEENGLWICGEIPSVPKTLPVLTLGVREDLDREILEKLLDSESGNVQDITEGYLAQREKEFQEMAEEDRPLEWLGFGDDSLLIVSDGQKEASFARNTCVSYVDQERKKACDGIYKAAPEIDVTMNGENPSAKFPVSRGEEMLLEKLAVLDITEIGIAQALYYELDGTAFYEFTFTPSYESTMVASEFGSVSYGEVQPRGTAWVTEDGIAVLNLENFCGKTVEKRENGNILTFSQVTDILQKYLEADSLCGASGAKLTRAEICYYPTLRESKLILTPAWHIYAPLKEMMEALESGDTPWQSAVEMGAVWNLYLDAVTGEIIKAE